MILQLDTELRAILQLDPELSAFTSEILSSVVFTVSNWVQFFYQWDTELNAFTSEIPEQLGALLQSDT